MVDDESTTLPRDEGTAETVIAPASGTPVPLPPPPSAPAASSGPAGSVPLEGSRYELGEVIGTGGMGEVVTAFDRQIGRDVAIKRIRAARPTHDDVARFLREARVQGSLEHPAIVPVHDLAFDAGGRPFFVMKRLAGDDMHALLERMRRAAASDEAEEEAACRRRLLRAFVDVCFAVELAHSRGIVHRDLKPANVMLGNFNEVYVLDWGVARARAEGDREAPSVATGAELQLASGETQQGTVLGTPAYMAPEQLVGDPAGPPADIYALGCMLYEIAAGEPLHARTRSLGQAFTVVDARPSRKRPDCPPELDVLCERAIRIDPATRIESARTLGEAVQAFLDGDRDVAVRKELALRHVAAAREALARGTSEADRRAAMQAAGRALALDPTASDAADVVTRLMLDPPTVAPAEVEERLAAIDTETARSQGRLAAIALMGYLAFVPLLVWSGVREVAPLIAFVALALASGLQLVMSIRRDRLTATPIYVNACINAVLIGVVCRMVGPFIIAPTLVITTLMGYASHPRFGRLPVLAAILSAAVVIPWTLELAGVLAPTYHFTDDGALVLLSDVIGFSAVPTQLAFALLLVCLVGVVAALSRALAIRQRDATCQLELQAWHLRQIVPAVQSR
jgi:eukaryotic-like serine/threonine-protein kinase